MFSLWGWLIYAGIASFLYWVVWALGMFEDQATAGVSFIFAAAMSLVITIKIKGRIE